MEPSLLVGVLLVAPVAADSGGAKTGIAFATMLAVIAVGLMMRWWWKQQQGKGELDARLLGETWEDTVRGRGLVGKIHQRDAAAGAAALQSKQCYDGPMDASVKFIPFAAAERAVGGKFDTAQDQLIGVGGFGPVYRCHFPYPVLGLTPPNRMPGSPQPTASAAASAQQQKPRSAAKKSMFGSGTFGSPANSRSAFGSRESAPGSEAARRNEPRVDCAVKLMNPQGTQSLEQFVVELRVIAMCSHPHLLRLLAAVNEPNKPVCLITPYMRNGSLTHHLREAKKRAKLPWVMRLQIAIDTADALIYLHTPTAGKPRVIHRDIKPDNLLLDERMKVSVADFGLARELNHRTTHTGTAGTMFYIDPAYSETGELTEKSDTYSYGVVVLQLLTGEARASDNTKRPPGLVARVRPKLKDQAVISLADSSIKWPNQVCVTLGRMVNSCVRRTPVQRPQLMEVLQVLKDVIAQYDDTQDPVYNTHSNALDR